MINLWQKFLEKINKYLLIQKKLMISFYIASNNKKGYSNKLSKQMDCNQYHCESRANELDIIDCRAN